MKLAFEKCLTAAFNDLAVFGTEEHITVSFEYISLLSDASIMCEKAAENGEMFTVNIRINDTILNTVKVSKDEAQKLLQDIRGGVAKVTEIQFH